MSTTDSEILSELRKIRQLLEPKPPGPAPQGLMQEFKAFIKDYKVLGLAVAFIMGVYLGALVKALVTDLILPIVQFALPPNTPINTYTVDGFGLGDFANSVLTFIIVAFVIFLIVRIAKRYKID